MNKSIPKQVQLNDRCNLFQNPETLSYEYSKQFQCLIDFIKNTPLDERKLPNHSTYTTTEIYRYHFGIFGRDGFIHSVTVKGEYGSIIEFIECGSNNIQIINFQFSNALTGWFNDISSFFSDFMTLVRKVFDSNVEVHLTLTNEFFVSVGNDTSFESMFETFIKLGFVSTGFYPEDQFAFLKYSESFKKEVTDYADDDYQIEHHKDLPQKEFGDDELPF